MVVSSTMDKEHLKVRTLRNPYEVFQGIDPSLLKGVSYLRGLDLTNSSVQNSPGYIGNSIYLLLLHLDGTEISCLSECMCISSLIDLQILNLQRCEAAHSLLFQVYSGD